MAAAIALRMGGPLRQTSLFHASKIQAPVAPKFMREPGDDTGHE